MSVLAPTAEPSGFRVKAVGFMGASQTANALLSSGTSSFRQMMLGGLIGPPAELVLDLAVIAWKTACTSDGWAAPKKVEYRFACQLLTRSLCPSATMFGMTSLLMLSAISGKRPLRASASDALHETNG